MIRILLAVAFVLAGCTSSSSGTGGAGGAGGGAAPKCGNGTLETDEECEGFELRGKTCVSEGFDVGTLKCTTACALDVIGCSKCGDGKISGVEKCDGLLFGGKTCASEVDAGSMGELSCASDCMQISNNRCKFPPGRGETCLLASGCAPGLVCDRISVLTFRCRVHCDLAGAGTSQGCATAGTCTDGTAEIQGATTQPPAFVECPTDGGGCAPSFGCVDAGFEISYCAKRTGYCQ